MCIIMFITMLTLFATLEATLGGYAGSLSNNVNEGFGYGYSGSYSGSGSDIPAPPIPNFENFGGLLNGYFDSFQKYHEQFLKNLEQQVQQVAGPNSAYAPRFPSYTGGFGGDNVNGGGAVASASVGPQGGYHTAAVFPENPNSPNIFSRFGETSQGAGTPGTYGVFTSSVSSSSNLDGKVQNFHRATTTINDNGKISTYTVKNP